MDGRAGMADGDGGTGDWVGGRDELGSLQWVRPARGEEPRDELGALSELHDGDAKQAAGREVTELEVVEVRE
jgi:hypothetical protein